MWIKVFLKKFCILEYFLKLNVLFLSASIHNSEPATDVTF